MTSVARGDRALRDATALCYVADLDAPSLSREDAHHLVEVLRAAPGERVAVGDGRGAYRITEVGYTDVGEPDDRRGRRARARTLELRPIAPTVTSTPPEPLLTVGFGIPKGDRAEWIVQKLTELGVDRIVPLLTDRTVVRLSPSEAERRVERFRRVSREAGAQSRRLHLPEVTTPCQLSDLDSSVLATAALAEPDGPVVAATTTTILIGPEGGWSEQELGRGLATVSISDQILRAETAAVAAGLLLVSARSGVVALRS